MVDLLRQRRALLRGALLAPALSLLNLVAGRAGSAGPFRVLHVMSYDRDWPWNREQFDAFRAALDGLDVDYRVIELDARRATDPVRLDAVAAEARAAIADWRPDLVYANDDAAQKHVVAPTPEGLTRFVFSGVNAAPETYGFDLRADVTGVLEREHVLQTLRLLAEIAPGARRLALVVDEGPTWPGLVARIRADLATLPEFELVAVHVVSTVDDYRRIVSEAPARADALGVLGVFGLKDANGAVAPFEEILRWTAENSRIPDFSFWGSRTDLGTLCAVTVSGRAQGEAAGRMARAILAEGKAPRDIPMVETRQGEPVVSLRRARALGLKLASSTLLKSRVVQTYAWD